jgi:hypothetical protein
MEMRLKTGRDKNGALEEGEGKTKGRAGRPVTQTDIHTHTHTYDCDWIGNFGLFWNLSCTQDCYESSRNMKNLQ